MAGVSTYGYYSYDGRTWTTLGASFSCQAYGIAWSSTQGMFVLVGSGGCLYYSFNGPQWITATPSSVSFTNIYGVAYSKQQNYWVITGSGTTRFAYSSTPTNGASWTAVGTASLFSKGAAVCWSPTLSLWIAVGTAGTTTMASTPNPSTTAFTSVASPPFTTTPSAYGTSCYYGNGYFVATGGPGAAISNTLAYSPDGVTWTGLGKTIFGSSGQGVFYSIDYARWMAVGQDATNKFAYSTNGVSWTPLGQSSTFVGGYGLGLTPWISVANTQT